MRVTCQECHQSHPWSRRTKQAGRNCVYSDPDKFVDKRLDGHRGLPYDCPGCLGHGTITETVYGRRMLMRRNADGVKIAHPADFKMECRSCGIVYYRSETR